jgi:hypothetical protein
MCAALADTVQLNEVNVEGINLPEELQVPPFVGTELYDYDQAAGLQQQTDEQQLFVVAVDGRQTTSSMTSSSESSQDISAVPGPAADTLPQSSVAAGELENQDAVPQPYLPPQQEQQAAMPAIALVHSEAPQAAANPAANAARVSAVPSMGVPPASSKVPGRYIVFFRDNVTSTQQGADRCVLAS